MIIGIVQQVVFFLVLGVAIFLIYKRIGFIRQAIKLGKTYDPGGTHKERMRNMWLKAFGQQKMFDKPLVGVMHFVLYASFFLVNIEILEIILDGLAGTHRLFEPALGGFYPFLIGFFEVLAVLTILVCVVFLLRRNVVKVPRLSSLKAWPKLDGNLILIFEIGLMLALLTMNSTDALLGKAGYGSYQEAGGPWLISQFISPVFAALSLPQLAILERVAWWVHILGILGFALYITYSKHLHIGLGFPNAYYQRQDQAGKMVNMPSITQEVKIMLGMQNANEAVEAEEMESFGAKDVNQLNWKHLMDAFSCTECGRCTAACPANQTGKKLSPRKIMMDTRDRAEEATKALRKGQDPFDGSRALYGDYITQEELLACTTCNACVEACPIGINPLDIILEQRRYMALEESSTPQAWNAMFQSIENSFAPWAFPPTDRFKWAEEVKGNKEGN